MSIPMMAEREEALRLWEAKVAAGEAFSTAYNAAYVAKPDVVAKYEELCAALDEQEFDSDDAVEDARVELDKKRDADLGIAELSAAFDAAETAWLENPQELMTLGDDGLVPVRCAKSGVLILTSDETVDDLETDECWLRSVLGLQPRPVKVEEEEIEEAA
jgi:hypothetical protein